jgi:CubicO group peptidase (beta-lactamase class C family)
MKPVSRQGLILLICLLFLLPACGGKPVKQPVSCQPLSKGQSPKAWLNAALPCLLKGHKVPGAVVAVVHKDGNTWFKNHGEMLTGSEARITPETIFPAGALSNPLFAYGVMKLVRDKRLHLDTPLAEYLDKPFAKDASLSRLITARMVLSHTSGLPNWRPRRWLIKRDGIYLSENPGPLRLRRKPGQEFGESGEAYLYLQKVVERIIGKGFESYIQELVFDSLSMPSGHFGFDPAALPQTAFPHDKNARAKYRWQWRAQKPLAAGSLFINARDYAKFLAAMLQDRIAREMLEPQVKVKPGISWSLGWGLEMQADAEYFWQFGFNPGFKHFAAGSRDKGLAVLVMTNGDAGERVYQPIVEALLGARLKAISWEF